MTKALRAPETTARKSALTVGTVLLLIAAWNLYRGHSAVGSVTGLAAAVLIVTAWLSPAGARLFHSGWMGLAAMLGWVNSRILLGIMFYGVITPTGRLMRLLGRDPLDRRGQRRETYWVQRSRTRQRREQFERPF